MTIVQLVTSSWSEWIANEWVGIGAVLAAIAIIVKVSRWTGITDTKIDFLTSDIREIKTSITSVLGLVSQKPISESKSPVQLNDYGKAVFAKINGADIIKNHLNAIEHGDGMNEYQLQQACFDYAQAELMDKISNEERAKLEKSAFDEGLPIQSILRILGIELRNAKFKELKKDTAVIDKHEPQE